MLHGNIDGWSYDRWIISARPSVVLLQGIDPPIFMWIMSKVKNSLSQYIGKL